MDLNITQEPAGCTAAGLPISLFTLTNRNGMAVRISTLGGVVESLLAPGRDGVLADVVGRHAGDLAAPGIHLLPAPGHALHRAAWHAVPLVSDLSVGVRLTSAGPQPVVATYALDDANELTLSFESALAPPATLGLHLWFNLAGEGDVSGHQISVRANRCVPAGGAEVTVAGTPWECRAGRLVGDLPGPVRYLLDFAGSATLHDPASGRTLEIIAADASLRVAGCEPPHCVLLEPLLPPGASRVLYRFSAGS